MTKQTFLLSFVILLAWYARPFVQETSTLKIWLFCAGFCKLWYLISCTRKTQGARSLGDLYTNCNEIPVRPTPVSGQATCVNSGWWLKIPNFDFMAINHSLWWWSQSAIVWIQEAPLQMHTTEDQTLEQAISLTTVSNKVQNCTGHLSITANLGLELWMALANIGVFPC